MDAQINNTEVNQEIDQEDVEKNKSFAILAYIIFLIPLLLARESKYAMYHANQGLILFLAAVILNVFSSFIPFIGKFLIIPFGYLALIILAVLGIVNASKGEMKALPIIGGINIIK